MNHVQLGKFAKLLNGDSDSVPTFRAQSHQSAIIFLKSVLLDGPGVGLIQGQRGSGKAAVVSETIQALPSNICVARINGAKRSPARLLTLALEKFGYVVDLEKPDELLRLLTVFSVHQARTGHPPVLIVENIDSMYPSSLKILCALASVSVQEQFALRIVLTGSRRMQFVLESDGMRSVAERAAGVHEMKPLTPRESGAYLYSNLRSCGVHQPDQLFPLDVCDVLHDLSGGWPGPLSEYALSAIRNAERFPLRVTDTITLCSTQDLAELGAAESGDDSADIPSLIVTRDGQMVQRFGLNEEKTLIGRSTMSDVVVQDRFSSQFHALLLRFPTTLVIHDLNSANGTFVNSVRKKTHVLKESDIISIANWRLKIVNVPVDADISAHGDALSDTGEMKTLDDMRLQRALNVAEIDQWREEKA